ncbi:DUF2878 family protein [Flocculibacter collagenilyticus]|uniref:DUF2878 family protein n=1 Tax=Flocculibacter collagenilyticus TaxID=2744479 RepID=UPI0018F2C0BD|nr:DUF2878 family protein [Flocculibacter collagenilyticus]
MFNTPNANSHDQDNPRWNKWWIDGLIFQAIWFLAVGTQIWSLVFIAVVAWLVIRPMSFSLTVVSLIIAVMGMVVDQIFTQLNWIAFRENYHLILGSVESSAQSSALFGVHWIPLWLVGLWLAFGRFMIIFLLSFNLPKWLISVIFAVAAAASYGAAEMWGVATLAWKDAVFVGLFVIWWASLPLIGLLLINTFASYQALHKNVNSTHLNSSNSE